MPLRSLVLRLTHYRLAYHPAYLMILLQEYLLCRWMLSRSSSIAFGVDPSVLGSQLGRGLLFLVLRIRTCHKPGFSNKCSHRAFSIGTVILLRRQTWLGGARAVPNNLILALSECLIPNAHRNEQLQ